MSDQDVSVPVTLGVLSAAASIALFFWRRHAKRTFAKMEDATKRHPTSFQGEEAYMALRGTLSSPHVFEAEYSGEKTVVACTVLRHRWAERTVTIEMGKRGERDVARYSPWEQREELVNAPLFRTVAFSVVHTDRRAAAGDVAVAVKVDCDATELPLVVRFSQSLEENKKTTVNVNNSNGGSNPALSGACEVRELGTLREESVLPLDKQLTGEENRSVHFLSLN